MTGCGSPAATQAQISISLLADGETLSIQIPSGSTVQQAIDFMGLNLNPLDRTEPPIYTVLGENEEVKLIRVTEEFDVEEIEIPYEQQTVLNETLPVGSEVLIQKGRNGVQEITYRRVYEDGIEISSQPIAVNSVIIEKPIPEIRMIGVQTPFAPVSIPGSLYYLRDGNVWIIEGTTSNRRAIITTGDLDGRIFSLSSDGLWLLFTRNATDDNQINSLWVANISEIDNLQNPDEQILIDLNVENVIHFADWVPGSNMKIIFSTVEPRDAAPGWQANNDLHVLTFSSSGWTTKWTTIMEPNSGGVYGWWGTNFNWAPDNSNLAFSRPDSIGLINYEDGNLTTLLEIYPFQTKGDWAWVPGLSWGPDGKALFTVNHISSGETISPEESTLFDLTAIPIEAGIPLPLVSPSGMFSYPLASPVQSSPSGEIDYQIAYLHAIFPRQSDSSRYRLAIMDRDGSNRRELFPPEETIGIEPQLGWGAWSPTSMPETGNFVIAIIYQGNLWLVDSVTGEPLQITGDKLTNRIIWR